MAPSRKQIRVTSLSFDRSKMAKMNGLLSPWLNFLSSGTETTQLDTHKTIRKIKIFNLSFKSKSLTFTNFKIVVNATHPLPSDEILVVSNGLSCLLLLIKSFITKQMVWSSLAMVLVSFKCKLKVWICWLVQLTPWKKHYLIITTNKLEISNLLWNCKLIIICPFWMYLLHLYQPIVKIIYFTYILFSKSLDVACLLTLTISSKSVVVCFLFYLGQCHNEK